MIQRDLKTGYFLQAKIFLADDPTCYARLYPQAEGTRVDVVMYGAVIKKGLLVSGLIYYVLATPFSSIVEQTRRSFDWEEVFGIGARSRASGLALDLRAAFDSGQPGAAMASAPALPALVSRSAGLDALLSGLAARGTPGVELVGDAALPAALAPLGLSDDSDPLVPALPYKAFPRYEAGKGLPLASVRAAIYLDALSSPDSAYALVGDGIRVLVTPYFDAAGTFRLNYFMEGREMDWAEVLAGKDKSLRIVRINLQG